LFNWLGQDLSGCVCLDLFAGTGVLGFEAASRGAQRITLVERDRRAFKPLCDNAGRLDAARFELICADALQFLAAVGSRYDLMFIDPPYRQGWLARLAPLLSHALVPGALVYAEAEERVERIGDWRTIKCGRAGQVHYHLLQAMP
jgi:16S rRNA (guanine966-N2)-methyltransferase